MSVAGAPAVLALFDIGSMEFLMILGAAVMLFGGDLPDVARKAGRTVRKLRTIATDMTKNLDLPSDLTRLPGAAEFREGLDMKDDLDLRKDVDLDWREVARLPAPGEAPQARQPAAAPAAQDAPWAPAGSTTQGITPAAPAPAARDAGSDAASPTAHDAASPPPASGQAPAS